MKKNYLEPEMKVSKIQLVQMIAISTSEGEAGDGPLVNDRSDLLDGLFD